MKIICITPITDTMMENLQSRGSVTYCPNINKNDLSVALQEGYDVIFTNPNKQGFMLDKELLGPSSVSVICTASTGTNHIDKKYCESNDITVLSITTDYHLLRKITSTAEHSFGLMLSLLRNVPRAQQSVLDGGWNWEPFLGRQINSLKVGIVGFGRLGEMMAHYCDSFGAGVYIHDPYKSSKFRYMQSQSLESLFKTCDVVSLHVHVTDETRHFINKELLQNITSPVYLINTSRGEVVDEKDIVSMLESGKLAGYATDVVENEFDNINDSPIIQRMDDLNIIVTPHIGGMTSDARELAYNGAINKLENLT
tara:strand:- start:54527 stop:55459 length:933 start_codon:yes stop_codon:yes gene_type:complete